MHAQSQPQPFPDHTVIDPPENWFEYLLFNNQFRIGGLEAGASTYGYSVGLPVFWVQDQLKLVPMAGWFWETPDGWSGRELVGGKVLYFFNKQQVLAKNQLNPYAGAIGLVQWKDHNAGLVMGLEPNVSRYLKVGIEGQMGLRKSENGELVFVALSLTLGIGW